MQMNDRAKALLEVFRQGLSHMGLMQTNLNLGDRQQYLGISDIVQYVECPRKAIASKLYPIKEDIASQLTLQRGHWFEKGIGESLASLGLNILSQLEISDYSRNVPLKAHLDFTLVWNKPELAVRVLEVKSMNQLPDSPCSRHELQISSQVALLQKYWNSPVFGIRDESGASIDKLLTFPEICQKYLGLAIPDSTEKVSVEGWLLYLSMKDAAAYGPYLHDSAILDTIWNFGERFWHEFQEIKEGNLSLTDLGYAQGFYPLCEYCHVNSDCTKFDIDNFQPQWESSISSLEELKSRRAQLDASIKELENALKQPGSLSPDWINTGSYRFKLSQVKGRRTLRRELLHTSLSDLFNGMGIEDISVDEFIAACEKEGAPSSRLMIQPVN